MHARSIEIYTLARKLIVFYRLYGFTTPLIIVCAHQVLFFCLKILASDANFVLATNEIDLKLLQHWRFH